jgi:DNA topoisomerase-3
MTTTVSLSYGEEGFHANGLIIVARNYLDVYPYDKWESSQQLPQFVVGETFVPTEANITDGKTTPPGYLTEPELIALMDVNGIGTDATMAEHISKIKERQYVFTRQKRRRGSSDEDEGGDAAPPSRKRRRGQGQGRGSSGPAPAGKSGGGVEEFVPSSLGMALVEGYDAIGFENSVSKPFLRKEMEEKLKEICQGTLTKDNMLAQCLDQYRQMFVRSTSSVNVLKNVSFSRESALRDRM